MRADRLPVAVDRRFVLGLQQLSECDESAEGAHASFPRVDDFL